MEILIPIGIVALLPLLYVVAQYNSLISLRNHIRDAWANIDTELKRRYDLIPNLVATVKGYAAHEREVLERVIELRNRRLAHVSRGAAPGDQAEEQELVQQLNRVLLLAESYPQLKADQHFLKLQAELVNTEDRIQAARRFYNGNVRDYRNKCETFPSNLVADMFGFQPADYFNVEPAIREATPARFT
jgi:LemA protein